MMNRRVLPILIILVLYLGIVLLFRSSPTDKSPTVLAAPNVFTGAVNGGCYQETKTICHIHIDRWQSIVPSAGKKLEAFQLVAVNSGTNTDSVLYDFRFDAFNPPGSGYLPSLVKNSFAASCGDEYLLALVAKDTGGFSYETVGVTNYFQCPVGQWESYLPTLLDG